MNLQRIIIVTHRVIVSIIITVQGSFDSSQFTCLDPSLEAPSIIIVITASVTIAYNTLVPTQESSVIIDWDLFTFVAFAGSSSQFLPAFIAAIVIDPFVTIASYLHLPFAADFNQVIIVNLTFSFNHQGHHHQLIVIIQEFN